MKESFRNIDISKAEKLPGVRAVVTAEDTIKRPWGAFFADQYILSVGKTRYVGRAMHWTAEARKEHEDMGFHEGWGKAAEQLETLARTL